MTSTEQGLAHLTSVCKLGTAAGFFPCFVDLLKMIHVPPSIISTPRPNRGYVHIQTATKLHAAGMKFKRGSNQSFLEMKYHDTDAMLEIPRFRINNCTEPLLRNLVSLELLLYQKNSYIIDRVLFMDGLIGSAKDVGILVNNGVVDNYLDETEAAANIFKRLTTRDLFWNSNKYYFWDISRDMTSYYMVSWNQFKANLTQNFVSSTAKFVASLALLITIVASSQKDFNDDAVFIAIFFAALPFCLVLNDEYIILLPVKVAGKLDC